jgi:hypothetical protein
VPWYIYNRKSVYRGLLSGGGKYLDIAAANFFLAFTETALDGAVSFAAEEHVIIHLSRDRGVGVTWKHVAML